MAYEGAGYEAWEECASNQPVFGEAKDEIQMLDRLDLWDTEHPQLSMLSGGASSKSHEGLLLSAEET
jgi:hypothetical protein